MPSRLEILPGTLYGKLTVIGEAESKRKPSGGLERRFNVRCECGRESISYLSGLRSGHASSCGSCTHETHALSRHPLYSTWSNMVSRCHNPADHKYDSYGARGIEVCPDWRDDPTAFIAYVSQLDHYGESGRSIDRTDNDRGYEPGNVRWATAEEQANNQRPRVRPMADRDAEMMRLYESGEYTMAELGRKFGMTR